MILNSPYISGSLTVTGNTNLIGALTVTGSLAGTATSSSFAYTASSAVSAYTASSAVNATTALTASYATSFTVGGTLTAQTLVVQTITSSVSFITGSTRFGSTLSNTHTFTGSVLISSGSPLNVGRTEIGYPFTVASQFAKTDTTGRGLAFFGSNELYASNPFGLVITVTGASTLFNRLVQIGTTDFGLANGGNLGLQTGGGSVGIGTTTPINHQSSSGLVVSGTGGNRGIIEVWDGSATGGKSVFQNVLGQTYIGQLASGSGAGNLHLLYGGTGGSANVGLFITGSNGSVGIGTTNPSFILDVNDTNPSGARGLRVSTSSTSAGPALFLYINSGTQTNWAVGNSYQISNALEFISSNSVGGNPGAAGTTRMLITNGGNVGIGTTSPTSKLFLLGAGSYNTTTSEILTSDATIFSSEMSNDAYNSILQLVSVRQSLTTGASSNGFLGFSTIDDSNGEGIRDAGRIAIVNETPASRNSATTLGFWTNPGGTKTTAATEKMRITSGGNVGIGNTNARTRLQVTPQSNAETPVLGTANGIATFTSANTNYGLQLNSTSDGTFFMQSQRFDASATAYALGLNPVGGYVYLGKGWGASNHRINLEVAQGNNVLVVSGYSGASNDSVIIKAAAGANPNATTTVMEVTTNSSTGRSISAGGTINASGTDYAEYMEKAVTDTIAKGDIVGINSDAKLTNIFADAISFVVKSTDPSYVGGDAWGNIVGKRPERTTDRTEEEFAPTLAEFEARLETAREKVDRIAFSGQVPCNITGANVGDYIVPIELENGKIGGQAISNPTFEQYQISVGKVWKIMEDGRAWIAVKIG